MTPILSHLGGHASALFRKLNHFRHLFAVVLVWLAFGATAPATVSIVGSFVSSPDGIEPTAGLLKASDGNFYGTASGGGPFGHGVVYKLTPDGTVTSLAAFNGAKTDFPFSTLLEGPDGNFYGATAKSIFKVSPDGVLTYLGVFGLNLYPSTLAMDAAGNIYGTAYSGAVTGNSNPATIYKMTPTGVLTILYTFEVGGGISGGLVKGIDGNFYGVATPDPLNPSSFGRVLRITPSGIVTTFFTFDSSTGGFPDELVTGYNDGNFYGAIRGYSHGFVGAVFRLTPQGQYTVLTSLGASYGPISDLIQGSDGNLYGTTEGNMGSGPTLKGKFFKLTTAGKLTIVKSFAANTSDPLGPFIESTPGTFCGVSLGTVYPLNGSVFTITTSGTLKTVYSFSAEEPFSPFGGVIEAKDGNFYGTTGSGGASGLGAVFKMTPDGAITTMASFKGTNGQTPYAGLVQSTDGNFYGTTTKGGTSGDGTIFRMTPAGTLKTLVSFDGTNGNIPYGALIQAKDGNLYGTTYGTVGGGTGAVGTVFKVTSHGVLTTLVSFNGTNGANPYAGLVQGSDGNFYGTTSHGGTGNAGTAFKLTSNGTLTTLVSFGGSNSYVPQGSLVEGKDGNFYGTTVAGSSGVSTIFKLTPQGAITSWSFPFDDFGAAGTYAQTGLILGVDGNFYGTAGAGTDFVYKVTPTGEISLMGFLAAGTGYASVLCQASDGALYGTTSAGGNSGEGAVFHVGTKPQTITFPALADQTVGYLHPVTLQATASSGLPVTYSVPTYLTGDDLVSFSGNVVTIPLAVTLTITATQAGDDVYAPATATQTIVINKGEQLVTFPAIPDQLLGSSPFELQTVGSYPSGPGTFSISDYTVTGPATVVTVYPSPFSSNSYEVLNFTGVGTVTVTATADANDNYNAASATQTFHVVAASQTISFPSIGDKAFGAGPFSLNATATSGLPVTYASTGPVKISGGVATLTGLGTVRIRASQSGNTFYPAAASVLQTFSVTQGMQTVTFAPLADRALSSAPFALAATSSSGLPIKYAAFGKATVSGNVVTLTGVGSVRITADQAGNADYSAATTVTQRFSVTGP